MIHSAFLFHWLRDSDCKQVVSARRWSPVRVVNNLVNESLIIDLNEQTQVVEKN